MSSLTSTISDYAKLKQRWKCDCKSACKMELIYNQGAASIRQLAEKFAAGLDDEVKLSIQQRLEVMENLELIPAPLALPNPFVSTSEAALQLPMLKSTPKVQSQKGKRPLASKVQGLMPG